MFNPVLSATVANDNWRTSLNERVAEVIDAYRAMDAITTELIEASASAWSQIESPAYDAASERVNLALKALPVWLRWIFV